MENIKSIRTGRVRNKIWTSAHFLVLAILSSVPARAAEGLDLAALERRILELTNVERKAQHLPVFVADVPAAEAARGHSLEMARLGYVGHESPTQGLEKPGDRIWKAGISSTTHGENVGLHSVSGLGVEELARSMVQGWMASPRHRENILNPRFSHLGVGAGRGNYQGLDSVFLTQTFLGRPVLDAKLQEEQGGFFLVSGRNLGAAPLVVYWREGEDVKFEDAAAGPGPFSHQFRLPAHSGELEVLLGSKKEDRRGNRTEFHFDFTDRFLVGASDSKILPPSR